MVGAKARLTPESRPQVARRWTVVVQNVVRRAHFKLRFGAEMGGTPVYHLERGGKWGHLSAPRLSKEAELFLISDDLDSLVWGAISVPGIQRDTRPPIVFSLRKISGPTGCLLQSGWFDIPQPLTLYLAGMEIGFHGSLVDPEYFSVSQLAEFAAIVVVEIPAEFLIQIEG